MLVTVYSRSNCHLCDIAISDIEKFKIEFDFTIEKILIDGNIELEKKYSDEVPVILINGKHHDFFRIDEDRFRNAMRIESRQRQ